MAQPIPRLFFERMCTASEHVVMTFVLSKKQCNPSQHAIPDSRNCMHLQGFMGLQHQTGVSRRDTPHVLKAHCSIHPAYVIGIVPTMCSCICPRNVCKPLHRSNETAALRCFNAVQEGHTDYDEEDDLLDVFDITEAEPDLLFVNPFGCQMDPLCWRELQVWLRLCCNA